MPTYNNATDLYGVTSYIVDATAGQGNFTTIGAALTAASSAGFQGTIFIRPGTYTENLTLLAGVNLSAFQTDQLTPTVIITGNCTASFAGTCTISGIQLKTNSAAFLTVSGASATIVYLKNCYLNSSNATGIVHSSSNASSAIFCYECQGNVGTTGITMWNFTSPGTLTFRDCYFDNTGATTTNTTSGSSGFIVIQSCKMFFPVANTSTNIMVITFSYIDTGAQNVTAVTYNSTASSNSMHFNYIVSGSASAISVGTGATLQCTATDISSSNTNVITGSGTINYNGLYLTSSSSTLNTSTIAPLYEGVRRSALQPCFEAQRSSAVSNVTGDATTYTILFNSSIFDQLSNYNTGTGTFTAPFTGRYLFSVGMQLSGLTASHTVILAKIVTTARSFTIGDLNATARDNNNNLIINGSVICAMSAGDTATVTIQASNGTKVVGLTGGSPSSNTYFSGSLLC